jgi:tRNA G18 (ribose-2'-O)-methylase SpoU
VRLEPVADLDDPRLAPYRDLRDATARERRGLFVAESRGVVRRLLAASRFHPRSVLLTASALASLRDVLEAADGDLPVYLVPLATLRAVVGFDFHRGCLALGERGRELEMDEVLVATEARCVLVLERVANPDNVGGVFRNALAFGAAGVLLSPGCGDPLSRKAIRVSIGASLSTPFASLRDWPGDLRRLRSAGFTVIALTPDARATDLGTLVESRRPPPRLALLLGTEGEGLSAGAVAEADAAVRIPMAGGVDSLNVATASGIALHRLVAWR